MARWRSAREAAWQAFGIRYWRWFVGLSIAWRLVPVLLVVAALAAVVVGVGWLVGNVQVSDPPPEAKVPEVDLPSLPAVGPWPWLALGVAVAGCLAVLGYRWWHPLTAGAGSRWLLVLMVLAAVTASLWIWQG